MSNSQILQTSVHWAVHGKPISSKMNIKYGLAGKKLAKLQKKKNSIMNRNGRRSSGVQKFFRLSRKPVCLRLAIISNSAVKKKKVKISMMIS